MIKKIKLTQHVNFFLGSFIHIDVRCSIHTTKFLIEGKFYVIDCQPQIYGFCKISYKSEDEDESDGDDINACYCEDVRRIKNKSKNYSSELNCNFKAISLISQQLDGHYFLNIKSFEGKKLGIECIFQTFRHNNQISSDCFIMTVRHLHIYDHTRINCICRQKSNICNGKVDSSIFLIKFKGNKFTRQSFKKTSCILPAFLSLYDNFTWEDRLSQLYSYLDSYYVIPGNVYSFSLTDRREPEAMIDVFGETNPNMKYTCGIFE